MNTNETNCGCNEKQECVEVKVEKTGNGVKVEFTPKESGCCSAKSAEAQAKKENSCGC